MIGEQEVVTLQRDDLQAACRNPNSLNLFSGLLLGHVMEFEFPETHQAYWALLTQAALRVEDGDWRAMQFLEKEMRFALGLPRGFAKTTLMKLFVCWMFIYTTHVYFLIVSATITKARELLVDVIGFMSCTNVQLIWGKWDTEVDKETQDLVVFKFNNRTIILQALGAGSSIRGTNIRNERPGVIICEDIQDKDCADSEDQNKKFIAWFVGTLLKARSYRRSFIVYIGNMYNEQCLLNQLTKDERWISLVTAALLHDGTSIWPEFRTKQSVLDEYKSDISLGQGAVFLAEVMNDPTAYASLWIDFSKIAKWPYDTDEEPLVSFLTVDPALGKLSSDNTAIATHSIFDGKACCMEVEGGKMDDTATVERALAIANEKRISLIAVESVAYQATLCNYFERTIKQRGMRGIVIVPISPHGIPKTKRIENYFKKAISGEVLIHPNALQKLTFQGSKFNPLKKDNEDDLLDAAAYGDQVLAEFWQELSSAMHARGYASWNSPGVPGSAATNSF